MVTSADGSTHPPPPEEASREKHYGMSGIIKRDLSKPLTPEESFANGHLTHAAMVSIAILTFITFCGNFTQLQLSAALPTIVAEFG